MKKSLVGVLLAIISWAAAPNPVLWKLEGVPVKPVKRGARFAIKLSGAIEAGWHLYSTKRLTDGPIPTRIWIPEGQLLRTAGPVQSPAPQTTQDPNFGMEVEYYQCNAVFTLPVQVSGTAPAGAGKAQVSVSYQACNDKICLPPKTLTAETPLQVAN
jgi:thiol:disulfide interchange protein DsbD